MNLPLSRASFSNHRKPGTHSQAIALALFLYIASPRQAQTEEYLDVKAMYYEEEKGRVSVFAPAFYYQKDISPTLSIRIDGIYNAISGATPTGAPPLQQTRTPVTTPPVSRPPSGGEQEDEGEEEEDHDNDSGFFRDRKAGSFHARAGATPTPTPTPTSMPSPESVPAAPIPPTNDNTLEESPTADVDDERFGLNLEVVKKVWNHSLSTLLSYSTETDYDSTGIALKDGIEFNRRNTVLNVGAAFTHDTIRPSNMDFTDDKDTVDFILGILQTLDAHTLLTANVSAGLVQGYLSDPYKVVELNGQLVPETRPDKKSKFAVYLALTRRIEPLRASLEGSYRRYQDSFDINGNTYSLAWFQELGERFILRPIIRYHDQSEADFYAVRFTGAPEHYSADYRLSALTAVSYGAKLVWKATQSLSFDMDYERYVQSGRNSDTPDDVYPTANIITAGTRLSFW